MLPTLDDAVRALTSLSFGAISASAIFGALVTCAATIVLATLVRAGVRRARARAAASTTGAFYLAERLSFYIVLGIGFVVAFSGLGVDMTTVSLLAGAIGVGVGLGLQDTVRNFMAGLFLLMDRSLEVGDFIELESGEAGEVRSVGPRVTVVVTNDNVTLLVPNGVLQQNQLTNWTRHQTTRRVHVPFKAPYGVDKDLVRRAALEAARTVPFTLPDEGDRRAQVWLTGFSESSYSFELVVWPAREAVKRPGAMMAAYSWAIDDALRRHGIEIPAPQLDLRVRRVFGREGDEGLAALGLAPEDHMSDAHAPRATQNDAAQDLLARSTPDQTHDESDPLLRKGKPDAAPTDQGPSTA